MKLKRSLSLLAAAALACTLAFTLASCSSLASEGALQSSSMGARAELFAADAMAQLDGAVAESAPSSTNRSIIKNGNLELTVSSAAEATREVISVTEGLGGTVLSQQIWNYGGSAQAGSVLISVPADKFERAFTALGGIGVVRSEQRSSDDVTEQHVDLAARVSALETSVGRLLELLQGATTTSDLIEIETSLSARQAELDGLKAQLNSLEGLIAEAQISVGLTEESVLPGGGPQTFWEALSIGATSIGAFASSAFIVLGVALPWLVIAGIITAAIAVPLRNRRSKRRSVEHTTPSKTSATSESVAETVNHN